MTSKSYKRGSILIFLFFHFFLWWHGRHGSGAVNQNPSNDDFASGWHLAGKRAMYHMLRTEKRYWKEFHWLGPLNVTDIRRKIPFLVADTRLYTFPCRSVGLSQTFLDCDRFLYYGPCPTVCDCLATLFSFGPVLETLFTKFALEPAHESKWRGGLRLSFGNGNWRRHLEMSSSSWETWEDWQFWGIAYCNSRKKEMENGQDMRAGDVQFTRGCARKHVQDG